MTHELKIYPEFFSDVASGGKTFEIRKLDRNYQVNDILILREYDPELPGCYTGNVAKAFITYILEDSRYVRPGFAVLGIKLLVE